MVTNRGSRVKQLRLAGLALAAGLLVGLVHPSFFGGVASATAPPVTHVVLPGETLWSLAEQHAPASEDPRNYIYDLQQRNHLSTATIYPGESLILP